MKFAKQTVACELLLGQCYGSLVAIIAVYSMYVTVSDNYRLYSGKRCILGEGKRLGGETVGLQCPIWLLQKVDGNVKTHATNVCLYVPTFCYKRLSIISRGYIHTPSDRV